MKDINSTPSFHGANNIFKNKFYLKEKHLPKLQMKAKMTMLED